MSGRFRVVSDEMRIARVGVGRGMKPWTSELMAGKTIFLPLNGKSASDGSSSLHSSAKHYGFRCRTYQTVIDGEVGLVAWWESKETP